MAALIAELIKNPIHFVNKEVDNHIDRASFLDYVGSNWNSIPLIGFSDIVSTSANNRIVRHRVLVQDILEKEFYNAAVEEVDSLGNRRVVSTKYLDSIDCSNPSSYIDFDSPRCVIKERQPIVCVPVPGESSWVNNNSNDGKRKYSESMNSDQAHVRTSVDTKCIVYIYPSSDSLFPPSTDSLASHSGDTDDYISRVKLLDMIEIVGIYTVPDAITDHVDSSKCQRMDTGSDNNEVSSSTLVTTLTTSVAAASPAIGHIHCLYSRKYSPDYPKEVLYEGSKNRSVLLNTIARQLFSEEVSSSSPVIDLSNHAQGNHDSQQQWADIKTVSELVMYSLLSSRGGGLSTDSEAVDNIPGVSDLLVGYYPLNVICHEQDVGREMWKRLTRCVHELCPYSLTIQPLNVDTLNEMNPRIAPFYASFTMDDECDDGESDGNVHEMLSNEYDDYDEDNWKHLSHEAAVDAQSFTPMSSVDRKAYRCKPSALQCGSGSVVLINELSMDSGVLTSVGTNSLHALQHYCNKQQATYQYNEYTRLTVPVNNPLLVLSQRRSVLLNGSCANHCFVNEFKALCTQYKSTPPVPFGGQSNDAAVVAARYHLQYAKALYGTGCNGGAVRKMTSEVELLASDFFMQCLHNTTADGDRTSAVNRFHGCLTLVGLIACSFCESEINSNHWKEMIRITTWLDANELIHSSKIYPI